MSIMEIAGNVLVLVGAITFVTAGLGIVRFPDVYTRASAVSTAAGLGIVFVMSGALLLQPSVSNLIKVVVLVALQLATASVGSIMLARSGYLTGVRMSDPHFDDLADPPHED